MTTPLTKLIAENKERLSRKAVFTDENGKVQITEMPSTANRLARVTELYGKFIEQLANADMAKTILDWPKLAQNIREQATAIAEGKE